MSHNEKAAQDLQKTSARVFDSRVPSCFRIPLFAIRDHAGEGHRCAPALDGDEALGALAQCLVGD
jgi:hypothetical protein